MFGDSRGSITEVYIVDNPESVRLGIQNSSDFQLRYWLKDRCGNVTAVWSCAEHETSILHDEFQHGKKANLSITCSSFDELARVLRVMDSHGVQFSWHESYEEEDR
jgi:hypothetical protein